MHLVTSSLMLSSMINSVSLSSASLLLQTYFVVSVTLYVSRGSPPIPISSFYKSTSPTPLPPSSSLTFTPLPKTLATWEAPNPWLPIVQTTLVHPNEHLCKIQRALLHFAQIYGGAAPGSFAHLPELEGAEVLDGTLFVRAAGLTADRVGWMREGQVNKADGFMVWDFAGFYRLRA